MAEYDFEAQNNDELTFKQGTLLTVAPKGLLLTVRMLGCSSSVFVYFLYGLDTR